MRSTKPTREDPFPARDFRRWIRLAGPEGNWGRAWAGLPAPQLERLARLALGLPPPLERQLPPRGTRAWSLSLRGIRGQKAFRRMLTRHPDGQQFWAIIGQLGYLALARRLRADGISVHEHMSELGRRSWAKRSEELAAAQRGQRAERATGGLGEAQLARARTRGGERWGGVR